MDDSEDGSNHDTDDCTVISNDANGALEMEEIVSYLEGAGTNYKDFLNTSVKPPVQPRGGTLILSDLGPDESQWESNKKKLRYSELCNHEHIELYQELLLTLAYTYVVCVYYTVLKLPLYLHRCDQYRWVHKGTRTFDRGNYSVKKKTGAIDVAGIEKQTGDNSFKRLEYWGIGSSYLIHYLGDHNAFVPCAHRNSKKSTKPFVWSAPHIKEKV